MELGRAFRKRYLLGLKRLIKQGKLKLDDRWSSLKEPSEQQRWFAELKATDWNVFIEGPPNGQSKPEHVLRYLTRYLSGGPIHDGRMISDKDGWVKFWARSSNKQEPRHSVPTELHGIEFVRRWALHILPKGFVRARRYGGYHPTNSAKYLEQCRQLLGTEVEAVPPVANAPTAEATSESESKTPDCPRCSIPMQLMSSRRRPSWKLIFDREVYRDRELYCPLFHIFQRGPPE